MILEKIKVLSVEIKILNQLVYFSYEVNLKVKYYEIIDKAFINQKCIILLKKSRCIPKFFDFVENYNFL